MEEVERLTLRGFPKILDLLEKEFLAIRSMRCIGQSNVDLRGVLLSVALEELATVS
jgi:hypothetical protein